MDMAVFGFDPSTSARILIVGTTTVIILALITAVARRWRSYWWVSIAFIITGCAGLALGSYFAMRSFTETFDSMRRIGGGISTVFLAISQATQPVLAAAWFAVAITVIASVFVLPHARKEIKSMAGGRRPRAAIFASAAALALTAAIASTLLFRRAVAFVLWVITPPAHVASVSDAIAARLLITATISGGCFLMLIALLIMTVLLARRSSPSPRFFAMTVFALVVSLGFSAALVANLYSFSNRYERAALTGRMTPESPNSR
jgi:hypothetical protein